jgi:hypothetical protein
MIMNYDALPPEFLGWRNFRIEYGGHAQDCIMERVIYVPPNFDVYKFEDELRKAAEEFDTEAWQKEFFPTYVRKEKEDKP